MSDLINRQAALNAIEKLILPQAKGETMAEEINRVAWRCAINCAEEMIGHLPTIEAQPVRHGKWTDVNEYHIGTCSVCGNRWGSVDEMHYCPNCGAKMDEVEE